MPSHPDRVRRNYRPAPRTCINCGHGMADHNMSGLQECYAPVPGGGLCQCHDFTQWRFFAGVMKAKTTNG
jgi:hypothetical protein